MSTDDYTKFLFNIDLLRKRIERNADSFNALPTELQEKIVDSRHDAERTCAARLSDSDRQRIEETFGQAIKKVSPNLREYDVELEKRIFFEMLNEWAVYATEIQQQERLAQEARKEAANSFVNAVSKTLDTMNAIDDASLGYLLRSGFQRVEDEHPTQVIPSELKENSYAFMDLADELKTIRNDWLRSFHAGMAVAVRNLPQVSRDMATPQFVIAAAMEDYLGRLNVPFTTTETGLAGEALHAVMTMAEIKMGKAGYWLDKAKKHENSWGNFTARMMEKRES